MSNFIISRAYARIDPTPQDFCDNVNYDNLTLQHLVCIFRRFYNLGIYTVSAVFVIWAIIAGIRFMTAGGNEDSVAAAKSSLTYAVLGFFLVIVAHTIITMLGSLFGIEFEIFTLPAASP